MKRGGRTSPTAPAKKRPEACNGSLIRAPMASQVPGHATGRVTWMSGQPFACRTAASPEYTAVNSCAERCNAAPPPSSSPSKSTTGSTHPSKGGEGGGSNSAEVHERAVQVGGSRSARTSELQADTGVEVGRYVSGA